MKIKIITVCIISSLVFLLILSIMQRSRSEIYESTDKDCIAMVTATRYGYLGFLNKYDWVEFKLINKKGTIKITKEISNGELNNFSDFIGGKNSLIKYKDKLVLIEDIWGNSVEWNVNEVQTK